MGVHDGGGVVDILDRVLGLAFFDNGIGGHSLRAGELGHNVGLDKVIVGRAASHDELRGDAGTVLTNTFEDSLALLG